MKRGFGDIDSYWIRLFEFNPRKSVESVRHHM